jgi:hypothetical protein
VLFAAEVFVLLLLIDTSRDGSDELLDEDDICEGEVCRTEVIKHIIPITTFITNNRCAFNLLHLIT